MSDLLGEDPAAEFLAQEGEQLRDLGIEEDQLAITPDPFAAPAAVPAAAPVEVPAAAAPEIIPAAVPAAAPAAVVPEAAPVIPNDVNFIDEFEADVEIPAQEPLVNGYPDLGMPDMSAPPVQQPIHVIVPPEEPESLTKWRQEKAAALQQQEKANKRHQQLGPRKQKKELDDWYNRYNEQLEKVQNENRAAQDQFIEEMTDTKPGNEWEKVARFCDFNPKFSKNTKDVSRMRSLLLQLKQNPLVR